MEVHYQTFRIVEHQNPWDISIWISQGVVERCSFVSNLTQGSRICTRRFKQVTLAYLLCKITVYFSHTSHLT